MLLGTTNGPSGTRAALEIPAAAQRSTRYRAPLPDAAHAIAAEAILGETVARSARPWTGGRLYTIKTAGPARRRRTCRGTGETTAARSTMSKAKAQGRLPEGVVLDPPSPVRVQCSVY